ncbi:hypothetical protein V9T40_011836 [Parthenolecanium corni]|uniref:von Hippel-Lindau disease tumour suppressor beta domain-containing protein n=1 Tax=Parthenolecanium corni TaxID=536013 RepID=A0AAN9XZW1_9HEMI
MNGLRSEVSEPLYLHFMNKCDKAVDIIWISFRGQYHLYKTLLPEQYLDVDTYSRHYWVFRETQSRTPLVANNKWYFCGEECGLPYRSDTPKRYEVIISRPIVTKLRSICIHFLCHGNNALKHCSNVKYLEIPVTLKRDIIKKIHERDPHSHISDE